MSFVTTRGTTYELEEPRYWHLTQPNDILLHNARLGEGIRWTVSVLAEQSGMQDVVTRYSLLRHDTSREQRFEAIRRQHFPDHQAVGALIVAGGRWHRADARWLDRSPAEWDNSARSYWAGEITADPRLEVIAHGGLYFPEWRTFSLLTP